LPALNISEAEVSEALEQLEKSLNEFST